MGKLSYSPATYRNMVAMSSSKFILVEGEDDKRSLMYLKQELFGREEPIHIHGANQIEFGTDIGNRENIGNRERVEQICQAIKGKKYAARFVGFVDREFREFELENEITDLIDCHNTIDRLIWSRGHSIENYYFDLEILYRPLRHHSTTSFYEDALVLFGQVFEQAIRLACAIGLAAYDHGLLKPAKSSISWEILALNVHKLTINLQEWERFLIQKQKIQKIDANTVIVSFQTWLEKVSETDFKSIRWLCHGHIGITFIWATYARCLFEVCRKEGVPEPQREVRKVLGADETVRFNGCASEWAQQASNHSCEYPSDIFDYLGLT